MSGPAPQYDSLGDLRAHAAVRPGDLAVYDIDRQLTFAELLGAVLSYMAELRYRGVRPGDVVAVLMPNVWRYVVLEIAVPAVDAVLLPLPPRLGSREIACCLRRCRPRLVVVDQDTETIAAVGGVAGGHALVSAECLRDDRDPDDGPPPSTAPGRIVEIALTSGTTGLPKLASLSAELKQVTFEAFTSRLGLGQADRMMPMSPISQGVGAICLYALRAGAGVVMTHDTRFEPDAVLRLVQASRATVLGGVPTMISKLLQATSFGGADLSRLRVTAVAGSPLHPALAQEWEQRSETVLCNFYGAMDLGHLAVVRPIDPPEARWTSVGRPHHQAEWQICDPDGRAVGAGEVGEVCMRGPLVQPQYWDSSETPYAPDGWAHFGDLGCVDADGFLHITGRVKDLIIRGGNNINPFEVESLLRTHPAIREVVVVGRPTPTSVSAPSPSWWVIRPRRCSWWT